MNKKIVSLFVALMMVAVAVPASAATIEELQAMIASLTAQISALSGTPAVATVGTNSATSMFDKDLTIGATGANVSDLQAWLVSSEYLVMPAGVSYGYFGPLTKSAVIKFQLTNGVPG